MGSDPPVPLAALNFALARKLGNAFPIIASVLLELDSNQRSQDRRFLAFYSPVRLISWGSEV